MDILWATPYCLLDTSSGASIAIRELLTGLVSMGHKVRIHGCTVFDNPNGTSRISEQLTAILKDRGKFIEIKDGQLSHELFVTTDFSPSGITHIEVSEWAARVLRRIHDKPPDIFFHYGNAAADTLLSLAAKNLNIPTVAYLGNNSYTMGKWYDFHTICVTDSQKTAETYSERGIIAEPIGMFIDPKLCVFEEKTNRDVITFVNPEWSKGAGILLQVADFLCEKRPDIIFEVWESRGKWSNVIAHADALGWKSKSNLANIVVKGNTSTPSKIYERTRLLFAPSIAYESAGRVVVEAQLNKCPVIVSSIGGLSEMAGSGGSVISFPDNLYESQNIMLGTEAVMSLAMLIEKYFDDPEFYQRKSLCAIENAESNHDLIGNIKYFEKILKKLKT